MKVSLRLSNFTTLYTYGVTLHRSFLESFMHVWIITDFQVLNKALTELVYEPRI